VNNEQAARIAAVQAATRYVTGVAGSAEDIILLADDLAHYILTGQTVQEMVQQAPVEHEKAPEQAAEFPVDPHQETVMAFATRAHQATSRAEVMAITEEVKQAGLTENHISMQGQRITLLNYLRECWKRLSLEEEPTVLIDPSSHDIPAQPGTNQALRTELGL